VKPTHENWRAIPGYEGHYEVSDRGRVRSLDRIGMNGQPLDGKIIEPSYSHGYQNVSLFRNGRQKNMRVHRVVMLAFVGPLPQGMVTRHLNGIKDDNRLTNLTYGTQRENVLDMVAHGNHGMASKENCKKGHPLEWHERRQQRLCPICTREKSRLYRRRNSARTRQDLARDVEIDAANERWVPIPGYEDEYSASDQGRIRSEERYVNGRWGQLHVNSKIMVGSVGNGYRIVGLMTDGKQKSIAVHHLILLAFVGPRPKGLMVRHLNDNRIDNRLANLAYGTAEQNAEDYRRNSLTA